MKTFARSCQTSQARIQRLPWIADYPQVPSCSRDAFEREEKCLQLRFPRCDCHRKNPSAQVYISCRRWQTSVGSSFRRFFLSPEHNAMMINPPGIFYVLCWFRHRRDRTEQLTLNVTQLILEIMKLSLLKFMEFVRRSVFIFLGKLKKKQNGESCWREKDLWNAIPHLSLYDFSCIMKTFLQIKWQHDPEWVALGI